MENYDLVVVGAGSSGISAALTAAEAGLKVALLEKGDKFGGAGMFGAQGLFGANTKLQKEAGVNYSVKDAYEEILNYTHHRSDARIVKAIIKESAETLAWMSKNGLATELVTNTQEVHQNHPRTYHQYIDKFNGFKKMINKFENLSGSFFLKTSAKKLLQDNGRLSEIEITHDGTDECMNTKNVILADGGFIGDKDLVKKNVNIDLNNLYSMGERKATGDGLRMLGEIGGVNNYKPLLENHAASIVTNDKNPWENASLATLSTLPLLWVDNSGKRFTNEDVVYDFALWGNVTYTAGGYYYIIIDQDFVDYISKNELDWTGSFERTFTLLQHLPMTHKVGPMKTLKQELDTALTSKAVFKADSLTDLAKLLNIDENNFVETTNQYNKLISKHVDDDFYKDQKFMKFPICNGPFYALKAISTTLGTVGGGLVNEKFQALTAGRKVIPGVYVVGNNAAGMFDSAYPTIEGLSNGFAWNSGRIAAKTIAKLNK